MSIKIIGDFWDVMKDEKNKKYFDRIFNRSIKRYPNPEGKEDSYNDLVLYFSTEHILDRFDPRKIIENHIKKDLIKKGKMNKDLAKKKAHLEASKIEDPYQTISDMGLDIQKKWYQFIGMYIEKRLNETFKNNCKYHYRYCHSNNLIDYEDSKRTSWMQTKEEVDKENEKTNKRITGRKKIYPTRYSSDYCLATHTSDPSDICIANDIEDRIIEEISYDRSLCYVYLYVVCEGYNNVKTAELLDTTQVTVGKRISKIRAIAKKICKNMSNTTTF
jgi:hypothetical protein